MTILKLGIHGATGRMGQALISTCSELSSCRIAYQYALNLPGSSLEDLCSNAAVIIDFSHPSALPLLLEHAIAYRKPLLIGTTGLSPELFAQISEAARHIPIIYAANTSIGISLLQHIIRSLLARYKKFDIDIIDIHHRHKLDAPSGTALMLKGLLEGILAAAGERKVINCCSIRSGGSPGEHQVSFSTEHETIILTHRAYGRKCFAEGAIKGAMWLQHQKAGLYDITESLQGTINPA